MGETIDVDFWETDRHSAEATIAKLIPRAQAKVYAFLSGPAQNSPWHAS